MEMRILTFLVLQILQRTELKSVHKMKSFKYTDCTSPRCKVKTLHRSQAKGTHFLYAKGC